MVVHLTCNEKVAGSNPVGGFKNLNEYENKSVVVRIYEAMEMDSCRLS